MPQTSSTQYVYQGFDISPNTTQLKGADSDYQYLQNVRGWQGMGAKRKGVQSVYSFNTSILGVFDAYVDGDASSLNKVFVYLRDGSLVFFDYDEINGLFTHLFNFGYGIALQSPDLTWYRVMVDDQGTYTVTEITTPIVTRSTDLTVANTQTLAFKIDSSTAYKLYFDATAGVLVTEMASSIAGANTYTTDLAFTTGSGVVFEDSASTNHRLIVENGGILGTIEI